jgi:phosphohistidine phosphatase SixA
VKRAPLLISIAALVVCCAGAAVAQEAVYVVRHAERADQSADSLLSPAGTARAGKLAMMLKSAGITHVFTSNLRRTIDTAAPLAAALQLTAQQVPSANTAALAAKISALGPHDHVLVVGHSNTVPDLLRALHVDATVTIADEEYDNLFIVVPQTNRAATLLRLKY